MSEPTYASTYAAFTDGMKAAAEICGSLAETTYDDTDAFEAATGCEAAIMSVVRQQQAEQSAAAREGWPKDRERVEALERVLRRIQDEANTVCGDWRETASLIDSMCHAALAATPGADDE